jgi:hypothetical protein
VRDVAGAVRIAILLVCDIVIFTLIIRPHLRRRRTAVARRRPRAPSARRSASAAKQRCLDVAGAVRIAILLVCDIVIFTLIIRVGVGVDTSEGFVTPAPKKKKDRRREEKAPGTVSEKKRKRGQAEARSASSGSGRRSGRSGSAWVCRRC